MQVGNAYNVIVNKADVTYTCGCQIKGNGTSQSSDSNDEYTSGLKSLLSLFSDFGKKDLAMVSFVHGL